MKLLQIALSLLLVLSPIACASLQDKTPDAHKTDPDVHETAPDVQKITSDAIRFYQYFSVGQLVGVCGNIEKKSANFKVKLPEGFKETLTKLEAKYHDEWTAFYQNTDCCIIYYGWIRGNVIGEYKLRLCETHQIDLISLTRHGVGGMAFSRLVDTNKTDKKASSSYDWFKLPLKVKDIYMGPFSFMKDKKTFFQDDRFRFPLKGRDKWGPFDVDTVGEIIGTGGYGEFFSTGKFMVGSWDTDHGACGNYKGTFYGIRLDSVKTASASITDQRLYQTMINFESLKKVETFGITRTTQEHSGDTGTVEENTSPVYTIKHSNVYHKSNCPELSNEELVEFASSQQSRNAGGVPCENCNP